MKRFLFLVIIIFSVSIAYSQDTTMIEGPWKSKGMATLNFSQVQLSNWAQGGESSYAINALSAFSINYAMDNTSWENNIDVGYGIQKIGNKDAGKTDDHLELLSKYGYKASRDWFVSGMVNFKTQFTKGFMETDAGKVVISDFMSPGYILLAIGMEYKPSDSFFFSASPLGGKLTLVMNDSLSSVGSFGVEAGKNARSEFGATVKMGVNREILKNVTLTSTLDLFSNYLNSPLNIDISWKAMINMKVNEFLSANISGHLIYDDDIDYIDSEGISQGPQVQFKEILGIGLSVKF